MQSIKETIKHYMDKDYFKITAAGTEKVRKTNKLVLIGAGTLIFITLFYLILFLTTNYYKLDDFEDYVEELKEGEVLSNFEKINLGIKIMPSYNLEKNILFMRHSKDVSIKFLKFKFLIYRHLNQ